MANKPKQIIKEAKKMINDGYVYIYGCKGEKVTKEKLNALMKQYPSVFTRNIRNLSLNKIGKTGIDCSGYVNKAAGTSLGGSYMIHSSATKKWSIKDLSHVQNGMYIWRNGHIGLIEVDNLGKAWILEAQSTASDLKRTTFETRYKAFSEYGMIKGVDYSSAKFYKKKENTSVSSTSTTSSKNNAIKVNTAGSNLKCRKSTSTLSATVGKFKNETKLTLIEKTSTKWYKVTGKSIDGKIITGYCSSTYLK